MAVAIASLPSPADLNRVDASTPVKKFSMKARRFAREAHDGQTRDDGMTPYYIHVERVAAMVSVIKGMDDEHVAAAYLHDVDEDTEFTIGNLRHEFNPYIADLVDQLTNRYTKGAFPELNRAERKKREHDRLMEISLEASIIKLIDRLDNLRDIKDPSTQKDRDWMMTYADESMDLASKMLVSTMRYEDESGLKPMANFLISLVIEATIDVREAAR